MKEGANDGIYLEAAAAVARISQEVDKIYSRTAIPICAHLQDLEAKSILNVITAFFLSFFIFFFFRHDIFYYEQKNHASSTIEYCTVCQRRR